VKSNDGKIKLLENKENLDTISFTKSDYASIYTTAAMRSKMLIFS